MVQHFRGMEPAAAGTTCGHGRAVSRNPLGGSSPCGRPHPRRLRSREGLGARVHHLPDPFLGARRGSMVCIQPRMDSPLRQQHERREAE
jgi:hypothetical protein